MANIEYCDLTFLPIEYDILALLVTEHHIIWLCGALLISFAMVKSVMCLQPLVDQSCSPHWQQADQDRLWQRNCLTALSVPKRCVAVAHRRVGRGGRCVTIYNLPISPFILSFLVLQYR